MQAMYAALDDLARSTRSFLEEALPTTEQNWWEDLILSSLTFQQKRIAEEKKIETLADLDLAGLLRILDQNWRFINERRRLPYEARNWLKEAQSIRNRWAHLPPGGTNLEDQYRDLDTVLRLMAALDAEESLIEKLREARDKLFSEKSQIIEKEVEVGHELFEVNYAKGSVVRLKANPTKTGAVIDILTKSGEVRYSVFHDGTTSTYYDSQLELVTNVKSSESVDLNVLNASLSALQLRHPNTTNLYSLFASRIHFVPYQFRPVVKLIQSDRPRLLIADEVGVGKTIEAGLILKELQARQDIRSVLIICPKPLVSEKKWLTEMKRFDEQFVQLDGPALRYCIQETDMDGVWPQQYSRAIVPYSLFDEALLMGKSKGKSKELGLLDLDPPPNFDLIIIDEAHHIRNTGTWAYRTVRYFCDNAEAVVMLSATPIQLGDEDLFTLLQLLRPDTIRSKRDFDQMSEPNPFINYAIEFARSAASEWNINARNELKKAISTSWGSSVLSSDKRMQQVYDLLNADQQNSETRLQLINQLESLYTFSNLINRTRRRDIGNFTTRKPQAVEVQFTSEQQILHDSLLRLRAKILSHYHGSQNLTFMLSTLRRQVASCVYGLAPLLQSFLDKRITQLELSEFGDEDSEGHTTEILEEFREETVALLELANGIKGPDLKFEEFAKVIDEKQKLPNNKLLVFTSFRHTLTYLQERLINKPIRMGVVHGDIDDEERRTIRNRFGLAREDPQALDLLLSTEVGCEGLDYQFCDCLVNYDIPWNPMRVEQRIGRIDRYGQKSEAVAIYNFITPGTIDAEIYERCLIRIGVFRQALGGSEEILGRFTHGIKSIAEDLTLSQEEQALRLQQLADNQIRLIQEQEKLEEYQRELFGLTVPQHDAEMVKEASSYWLSPKQLANLVRIYLEKIGGSGLNDHFGLKPISTLKIRQEVRENLLIDFQSIGMKGTVAQAWERWLKGSEPYLSLTFDQASAEERRDITFITPIHPLVKQAAQNLEPRRMLNCDLTVESTDVPPGRYPYAIYRWIRHGLKEEFDFQPICEDKSVQQVMLDLLESADSREDKFPISVEEEEHLERVQHELWCDARADHIEDISAIAKLRIASLTATHEGRLRLLEEQRDSSADDRIRRMRDSQIDAANRDYEKQIMLLEQVVQRGDIVSEPVVSGVLRVRKS